DRGAVRIGGRPPRKGDRTVAGARVEVRLEAEDPRPVPQPELPLSVLHVDPQLVAVDKTDGMPSHPLQPGERGTVVNALVARYPECADASDDPREGGLVHRLDTLTSGVLLAARDAAAWRALRDAFTERRVEKVYLAVVTGPVADTGDIDLPLRHRGDHVEPALGGGGREALTSFQVRARAGDAALLEVRIQTGVLHQIRAHLAAVGAPVLGDLAYGGRAHPGLDRFFLHAARLGWAHPISGARLEVSAPLPSPLPEVLAALGLAAG
ncbi:MAG TPA: pseudouridine synthase, partial [Myxococcaceae bacterium]|nr:pseudouridine synthase [Myxococcaceae bacterium]